jgi:hypothetical protein
MNVFWRFSSPSSTLSVYTISSFNPIWWIDAILFILSLAFSTQDGIFVVDGKNPYYFKLHYSQIN